MSVYNETKEELQRSVFSILDQTYDDLEFIIVNDNPKNEMLRSFLKNLKDKRVRIVENEQNMGLVASLNRALSEVNGEYVARMDADDYSFPERLAKQMELLEREDLDIVGSAVNICSNGSKTAAYFPLRSDKIARMLKHINVIPHPTWLLRKEVYDRLGGYRNIKACEDYDFLLRCLKNGFRMGNLKELELDHYVRDNSISKTNLIEQILVTRFLKKRMKQIDIIDENDIEGYKASQSYTSDHEKLTEYYVLKESLMNTENADSKFEDAIGLLKNKFFYEEIKEKIAMKMINFFWRD